MHGSARRPCRTLFVSWSPSSSQPAGPCRAGLNVGSAMSASKLSLPNICSSVLTLLRRRGCSHRSNIGSRMSSRKRSLAYVLLNTRWLASGRA